MATAEAKFEGWAVIGLFGHQKEAGFVTTEYFGGAALFRIEVPELPEREWVLERPERGPGYTLLPVGTKVKRKGIPARTRLVGPSAIYDLNPCTEEVARHAIESGLSRPLIVVEMPAGSVQPLIAESVEDPEDDDPEYDPCDDESAEEDAEESVNAPY